VGYVVCGMKSASEAHIGDTFHHLNTKVELLPGFQPAQSMVKTDETMHSSHLSVTCRFLPVFSLSTLTISANWMKTSKSSH
jgi:hypothetical protein